jgi:hypothetical protein
MAAGVITPRVAHAQDVGAEASTDSTTYTQKDEYKNQYTGQFTPGSGFDIIRTSRGSLNISVYGLFRFIDQMPGNQTFTDHLGRERATTSTGTAP